MSAELSVVGGLSFISAIFGFYAFRFRESTEDMNQKLSVLFFFLSIVFLNLVTYSIYLISKESVTFLTNGVMRTAILVMVWFTVILAFFMMFALVIMAVQTIKTLYQKARGRYVEES